MSTRANESQEKALARLVAESRERGEGDAYAGKRRCARWATYTPLEVTEFCATPPAFGSPAILHNVSDSGVAFWAKRELALGDKVYIREHDPDEPREWIAATVAHCTQGVGRFLIGVRFDAPVPTD